jgi:hypothetical protein
MDIVVAAFRHTSDAANAASQLASELALDADLVSVEPLLRGEREEEPSPGEAVLVAWVAGEDRGLARDLISRYSGRHVPLDWLNARGEEVAPETFPVPPRPMLWQGS